jgi:hypothetical protein
LAKAANSQLKIMDSFDVKIQQSTFELLTEVGDYLARLPAHPMTRAMYQKMQAHLNNPLTTAQSKRLKDLADAEAKAAMVKSGMSFWGTHWVLSTC